MHDLAGEIASSAARHDGAEAFFFATELDRERGDRTATARAIAGLGRTP